MRQLLSGIRVAELDGSMAAAYCGKLFADLGADVVKIESEPGDGFRGGAFLHLNTNKRSTLVDRQSSEGQDRLAGALARSHLVIEAKGGGELRDWGLDWDGVHHRWPGLSVVSISGFGATGPYSGYRWDDLVAETISGTLLVGRSPEGPVRLPGNLGSCFVGSMAALGALAALVTAFTDGTGSFVDCAATEVLASIPARQATLLAHQYRGGVPGPSLMGAGRESLIPTGVFPCGDGYVALMSTPQQLGEMLEVLDDDNLRAAFARPDAFERGETKEAVDAALYPWLLSRTRAEATQQAQRVGWPLAGVNSPDEVLAADHLRQRGFWVHTDDPTAGPVDLPGSPCRFSEGGWTLRRLAPRPGQHDADITSELNGAPDTASLGFSMAAGGEENERGRPPLTGIRVVDLTTVWSGPYATMLLADLGAEVIRVENPWILPPTTKGYQARPTLSNPGFLGSLYGPPVPDRPDRPWNRHAMNNSLARNKLSCTIDTRRPEGRDLLLRLADMSDVFIDNFKANGLARLGVQPDELLARNPRLVVVRMPPAGLTGDWSGYTGFGAQFDGLSSMAWLCGHRDSDLMTTPATTYMDAASGPGAAFATVAALRYRDATGRGQVVEFAQIENILNHLGDVFVDCQMGVEPQRWGNRHPRRAPQGLYRCRGEDQWLAVSVDSDEAWRALVGVMGRPDLESDRRYADAAGRQEHQDDLDAAIAAWCADHDATDAFHTLQRAGVAAGPLLDDTSFTADPQLREREWLRPLESLDVGTHLHPGLAFRGVPQQWRRGSPVLGQDNEYVYKELLGVSDQEFEDYRRERILADDYLDPDGRPY